MVQMIIGIGLLWLCILAAIAWWVYKDAKKHSDDSPFLWAVVVFLAPNLLGYVLYLLLGRDDRKVQKRTPAD